MNIKQRHVLSSVLGFLCLYAVQTGAQVVSINPTTEYQTIRGFGGMNGAGWINDLTTAQVDTAFGSGQGQLGLSIMRMRIDPSSANWGKQTPSAARAHSLGAILLATPWSAPASMKSNGSLVNGGKLLPEYYSAYATHLLNFTSFMARNNAPIYALSLQNEPDWHPNYESGEWAASDFVNFLGSQGSRLGLQKVLVAESLNFNQALTDPILNSPTASSYVNIIGGHLYGKAPQDYALARSKGKELWMTEHYTDNNDGNAWPSAVNVGTELHKSMAANFNAYIWWYIRRSYGLLTEDGKVSKRGYVMSQYARFVRPGYKRIGATETPYPDVFVTAYKSPDDKIVMVVVNNGTSQRTLNVTLQGSKVGSFAKYSTTQTLNVGYGGSYKLASGATSLAVDPKSVTTFVGDSVATTSSLSSSSSSVSSSTNSSSSGSSSASQLLTKSAIAVSAATTAAASVEASNPVIWADVPDPDVIRVGNVYYMVSTTMHMSPGVPIMKSTDLINWSVVNYAYDTLAGVSLENGKNAYGKGSWASSLRYVNGTYYVSTFSYTTNKTYIFKTKDIENGPWTTSTLNGVYHDSSLFFDNGRVFLAYGSDDIKLIELTADASAIKQGGLNQTIIPKASSVAGSSFIVAAEGAHIQKINGQYYISLISWPSGKVRSQLIYRASTLTGPYQGRVALQDQGVAQGGLIDTPSGTWYAFLFRDSGAVGRIPYLVPVTWQDGWPVMGVAGKVPQKLGFSVAGQGVNGVVSSDEFNEGQQGIYKLPLVWQWNHNPDNNGWSLAKKPGYLRLTTTRVDADFLSARNALTQRAYGPQSSAVVALETSGMKDGDYAGLGALQVQYGLIGVKKSGNATSLVMTDASSGTPKEVATVGLTQNRVYLRIDMDFRNQADQAKFYYSLDGTSWKVIGNTIHMTYDLKQFMGYRFALYNFGTKSAGGSADFDYFRLQ